MLDGDHAALAVAIGAGDLATVGAEARPFAVGARRQAIVHDLLLGARGHFLQRQAQAHAHVTAFLAHRRAAGGLPAEEGAEDVAHAEPAAEQVLEVDVAAASVGAAAAGRAGNRAEAIVCAALLRVGQHVVGLVQLFELVLGIGRLVHVRVKLARAPTERLLDLVFGRLAGHAQNFVQILRHCALETFPHRRRRTRRLPCRLHVLQRRARDAHRLYNLGIIHARGTHHGDDPRRRASPVAAGHHRHAR